MNLIKYLSHKNIYKLTKKGYIYSLINKLMKRDKEEKETKKTQIVAINYINQN
jgi:hypothetical protein